MLKIRRSESNENFDEILDRIKAATGTRTQVELAEILNIRQSSISDAKRRKSVPADWYLKLYRSHGLNPDWLFEGQEPKYLKPEMAKAAKNIQTVSEVPAAYNRSPSRSRTMNVSSLSGQIDEDGKWIPDFIGQLSVPEIFYIPSVVVVKVDGSAMEPLIRRGAYVGLDTENQRVLSGEVYGIQSPHEGLVIKRVFFDADKNQFILRSENQAHPEQTMPVDKLDENVVGRVVWVIQEI